jgi:hypothetical protein
MSTPNQQIPAYFTLLSNENYNSNDGSSGGRLYQSKLVLGSSATSDAQILPSGKIAEIDVQVLSGSPTVYITTASIADIKAGTSNIWVALTISGITKTPLGITAIYVVADGSGETVILNVRTND